MKKLDQRKTPYLDALKKYVSDNGLQKNIIFAGYQKNIDFSKYDVGMMCSPAEAFGRVTAEYMSNGLAVIGANGGATPEIVTNNKTGLLFNVDDKKDLAKKMLAIIKDGKKVKEYGILGYNRYLKTFSEESYQNNIYDVILNTCHL